MIVVALDPGDKKTAAVVYQLPGGPVLDSRYDTNEEILKWLRGIDIGQPLVIEMIASYGMPVGQEVFETCVWIGRFVEAWSTPADMLYRKEIKMHLCGSTRAKDSNVRMALIDGFGGGKVARGTKRAPGPLYKISGDKWSALAVAVTWGETRT